MNGLAGPPMPTAEAVALQRQREDVYDVRWRRHRDQLLTALLPILLIAAWAAGALALTALLAGAALLGRGAHNRWLGRDTSDTGPGLEASDCIRLGDSDGTTLPSPTVRLLD